MEGKANILIVDDNTSLCKTMSFIMGRTGCKVSIANDGLEAIEKVQKEPFDIIFMDIKMPQMNGVEAYRRIKKIRSEPEIVVMMTAYSVDGLVEDALQEGVYRVLYKPLDMAEVFRLVNEILERKQESGIIGEHRGS